MGWRMNVRVIDPTRKYLQSARPWRRGSSVDDFADLDGDGAAEASDDPRQPDSDPIESPAAAGEEGT